MCRPIRGLSVHPKGHLIAAKCMTMSGTCIDTGWNGPMPTTPQRGPSFSDVAGVCSCGSQLLRSDAAANSRGSIMTYLLLPAISAISK